MDDRVLVDVIHRVRDGDHAAVEVLVAAIQDDIYKLALRMVAQPSDAEDATQEILIKVLTRLSSFRAEAAVKTWVYRVAMNHLLDRRKTPFERARMNFDSFGEDLATGLADPDHRDEPEAALLAEEVKLGCTSAMLQCLDRDHRAAYVLGEIFDLNSDQASTILEITGAAYRKRLSRARHRVRTFMSTTCGIVNPANSCRCEKRIDKAIEMGRVDPQNLRYADHPTRTALATIEMEQLLDAASVMRSHPDYAAPSWIVTTIRSLISTKSLQLDLTAKRDTQ